MSCYGGALNASMESRSSMTPMVFSSTPLHFSATSSVPPMPFPRGAPEFDYHLTAESNNNYLERPTQQLAQASSVWFPTGNWQQAEPEVSMGVPQIGPYHCPKKRARLDSSGFFSETGPIPQPQSDPLGLSRTVSAHSSGSSIEIISVNVNNNSNNNSSVMKNSQAKVIPIVIANPIMISETKEHSTDIRDPRLDQARCDESRRLIQNAKER